jgi:hypothetical protein
LLEVLNKAQLQNKINFAGRLFFTAGSHGFFACLFDPVLVARHWRQAGLFSTFDPFGLTFDFAQG